MCFRCFLKYKPAQIFDFFFILFCLSTVNCLTTQFCVGKIEFSFLAVIAKNFKTMDKVLSGGRGEFSFQHSCQSLIHTHNRVSYYLPFTSAWTSLLSISCAKFLVCNKISAQKLLLMKNENDFCFIKQYRIQLYKIYLFKWYLNLFFYFILLRLLSNDWICIESIRRKYHS